MIERELTKAELKRREEIAKDLPDADFKKRYGKDWMSVKMATATKMAKKEMKEAIGPKDASDAGEYDYEGDMAKNQLKTMMSAAKSVMSMLDDNTNLPEWVQSKITKATDYIDSVRDYLESENGEEEIDEATSHTVRYRDPKSKERLAIPYRTHADAEKKMAQLKKSGVKEIEITMDKLKPGVKFKPRMETIQSLRKRAKQLLG